MLPPGTQREPITRSASVQGVEERLELLGLVGTVGVHLPDHVVAAAEGDLEPVVVRRAEALLAGAVQHAHARVLGRDRVGEVAGAVGRAVVDDQDVDLGLGVHAAARGAGARFRASL